MKLVMIYTDGACSGNPGPGGYGAVLIYNGKEKEISGGEKDTTNQRMELMAALRGLELLKEPCKVRLYSDSAYLINAYNNGWIKNWLKNGWKNSKKEDVSNKDLWLGLVAMTDKHDVTWHKVKGHSDNEYNNRCDELARNAVPK